MSAGDFCLTVLIYCGSFMLCSVEHRDCVHILGLILTDHVISG